MDRNRNRKHALVLTTFLQGHFFSIYRLALELAKKGVIITLVGLEKTISALRTSDDLRGLEFNLLSYQDVGSEHYFQPPGHPKLDILALIAEARRCFQSVVDKFVADGKAGLPTPTCLVGDRIHPWALDAAKELNIPYFQYFSCGAIYARELQARAALFDAGTLSLEEGMGPLGPVPFLAEFEGYMEIRGLPSLQYRDMCNSPPLDVDGVVLANDRQIGLATGKADGVIVNTCYELEAPQIDAIQQTWKEESPGKVPKLFLVGPIPNFAMLKNRSLAEGIEDRADCLQWLDGRPPRSVVFICIGTIANFSPEQIKEIALALEASEQSFLWVASRSSEGALPPNFKLRTRERGLTVSGWVPQLEILRHSAVGGFLTHCGWNSVIESITSGVPMATWPQIPNDQVLNSRYLVDVLKIAVEARGEDPNSSEWLTAPSGKKHEGPEKALRFLMSEEGKVLRSRVQELKKKVETAVADGGASKKAMDDLVQSIPPQEVISLQR